jgi:hypothetical protein
MALRDRAFASEPLAVVALAMVPARLPVAERGFTARRAKLAQLDSLAVHWAEGDCRPVPSAVHTAQIRPPQSKMITMG